MFSIIPFLISSASLLSFLVISHYSYIILWSKVLNLKWYWSSNDYDLSHFSSRMLRFCSRLLIYCMNSSEFSFSLISMDGIMTSRFCSTFFSNTGILLSKLIIYSKCWSKLSQCFLSIDFILSSIFFILLSNFSKSGMDYYFTSNTSIRPSISIR